MSDRKVSLIIPVYNTVNYLRRCLESAVSQTYKKMEIICVDDGSTDGSEKIVDEFAARDRRVVVVHQVNRGESHARNTGLRIASGDYIGFMDCDDWIEPDMYETLVRALEEAEADMAIAGFYREFEEAGKSRITVQNERDSFRTFAYIWDKLYRREIVCGAFEGPIFFDESIKLGGDVLYLAECALRAKRAVYVDKTFYHYLQREDSGCHMPDLERREDNIRAYQIVRRKFEERQVEPFVLDLIKRILVYHSSNTAELACELRNGEVLARCQTLMKQYEEVYKRLNANKPEWIRRFDAILEYRV